MGQPSPDLSALSPADSPLTRRPHGTRDRVLAVAGEMFYRDGIRATGVNAIVDEADTAKASLYRHFASKDDLVIAWLGSWGERCCAGPDHATGGDPAVVEGSRTLVLFDALEARVAGEGWRGCAFINAAVEMPDATHPVHAVIAKHKARLRERMEEAARSDGVEAAPAVAEALHLLFEGAIVASVRQGTPAPVRAARGAAARLLQAAGARVAHESAGVAGDG